MKYIFGMKINIKAFYKLILSFWVCATRNTQSTQNKFSYLSNISRKAWEMKLTFCLQINASFLQVESIHFLPADKPQRFLQSDTIILGVCGQASVT